jgi:hypothetical protein
MSSFEIVASVCLVVIAGGVVNVALQLMNMVAIMQEDAGLNAFNEAMTSAPVEKPKRLGPRVGFGRE